MNIFLREKMYYLITGVRKKRTENNLIHTLSLIIMTKKNQMCIIILMIKTEEKKTISKLLNFCSILNI